MKIIKLAINRNSRYRQIFFCVYLGIAISFVYCIIVWHDKLFKNKIQPSIQYSKKKYVDTQINKGETQDIIRNKLFSQLHEYNCNNDILKKLIHQASIHFNTYGNCKDTTINKQLCSITHGHDIESIPKVTYSFAIPIQKLPHREKDFTQGFVLWKGLAIETTGIYDNIPSTIRQYNITTGITIKEELLPYSSFGEGVTIWEDKYAIVLTWKDPYIFIYNLPNLTLLHVLHKPRVNNRIIQGWGITTWDKCIYDTNQSNEIQFLPCLIISDGTDTLYFTKYSLNMLEIQYQVRVFELINGTNYKYIRRINELEMVNNRILANIWFEKRIVVIHPITGMVTKSIHVLIDHETNSFDENAVLNGISVDTENDIIYITGKLWHSIYSIHDLKLSSSQYLSLVQNNIDPHSASIQCNLFN